MNSYVKNEKRKLENNIFLNNGTYVIINNIP